LPVPRPLRALRRHQHGASGQRVHTPVRMQRHVEQLSERLSCINHGKA
jgi:hypothetical protein